MAVLSQAEEKARDRVRLLTGTEIIARQKQPPPARALEQRSPMRYGGGNSPVRHQVVVNPEDHGKVAVWDKEGYLAVGSGGAGVIISDAAPANATQGQLWWDSVGGQLYIWYDDGTSAQWVIANKAGGAQMQQWDAPGVSWDQPGVVWDQVVTLKAELMALQARLTALQGVADALGD